MRFPLQCAWIPLHWVTVWPISACGFVHLRVKAPLIDWLLSCKKFFCRRFGSLWNSRWPSSHPLTAAARDSRLSESSGRHHAEVVTRWVLRSSRVWLGGFQKQTKEVGWGTEGGRAGKTDRTGGWVDSVYTQQKVFFPIISSSRYNIHSSNILREVSKNGTLVKY